jgi:hypothetical protein
MTPQTNKIPLAYQFLVFLLFLLLGASLTNLNGGDWDGVQIVLGTLFPVAAAKGYIVLYRPDWQPLTYGILRAVYALTHSVPACMFLPAVFGAAGLTFFLGAMRKVTRDRLHVLVLVGILLLIPELLFGSIYMNSTVFGFAFAAAAFWLAVDDWMPSLASGVRYGRQFLAGSLLALACLCRFDFLLTYPMFLFLLVRSKSSPLLGQILAWGAGSLAICGPAYLGGMIHPHAMANIVASHEAGSMRGGWFCYSPVGKILLTIIGANVLVWMTAGAGILHVLRTSLRQRRWLDFLGLGALAALLYPVLSINSPKYLVPFYMFMGLFVACTVGRLAATERLHPSLLPGVLGVAVLLAGFLPIHPSRNREAIVRLTTETWRGTDDGPRSFWGYMFALRELSREQASLQWLTPVLAAPGDVVLVAPFDGWIANCSVSQPLVFHLASHGKDVEIGPDYLWAHMDGKRVLLTEPGALHAHLAERFGPVKPPPRQCTIPLLDIPFDEIVTLRRVAQGVGSETELAAKMKGDSRRVHEALASLVRRNMIEPSGPGTYHLKHRLHQLRFYPDPTGGDQDSPDECCGAGVSSR